MGGVEAHDSPPLVDDVVESINVAGILVPIGAVMLTVVLSCDSIGGEREVSDRNPPPVVIGDLHVHLGLGQAEVDDVEPQLRLLRRVGARPDPPERADQPSLATSTRTTPDFTLQLLERGERLLPPNQGITRDDEFSLGE